MRKRVARCGVVYWYEQKPVAGKQEIKPRDAVRRMTKKGRLALLKRAQAEIQKEIERVERNL